MVVNSKADKWVSEEEGAYTQTWAATTAKEKLSSGAYYVPVSVKTTPKMKQAKDVGLAKESCVALTDMSFIWTRQEMGFSGSLPRMSAEADVKLEDFSSIFSLPQKVAVVTGGSRGLGLHAASGLLQAGCSKVFITSRKAKACEEACDALNKLPGIMGKAISVPADISKVSEIERLVAEVGKHTDHVDILFANAGATWGAPFDKHPAEAFAKVMDLNVNSVFYCIQKFAPLLEKKASSAEPSRVLVTASVAGIGIGSLGENATPGYSASKAAALHLTRNLAVELGPRGILCNSIAPGFFPTKMANGLMALTGGTQALADANPNKRLGKPEDIAGTVVYLCSRASSHLNGAHIVIDGGSILGRSKL
ncbi:gluconate 5-dehydrogenase [Aureobasidium pullulans]|nr:gluconate 5-dehydrogenase [Aureobasidium pullulans]